MFNCAVNKRGMIHLKKNKIVNLAGGVGGGSESGIRNSGLFVAYCLFNDTFDSVQVRSCYTKSELRTSAKQCQRTLFPAAAFISLSKSFFFSSFLPHRPPQTPSRFSFSIKAPSTFSPTISSFGVYVFRMAHLPIIRPWPPVLQVSRHVKVYGESWSAPRPTPNLEG